MKYLFGCFSVLTFLALTWVCVGTALWSAGVQQVMLTPQPGVQSKQIQQAAGGVTLGIGASTFACTGLPVAVVSLFFALVCYSSWQTERRHREFMDVEHSRNNALSVMAMTQIAQAQHMQNDRLPRKSYSDEED